MKKEKFSIFDSKSPYLFRQHSSIMRIAVLAQNSVLRNNILYLGQGVPITLKNDSCSFLVLFCIYVCARAPVCLYVCHAHLNALRDQKL